MLRADHQHSWLVAACALIHDMVSLDGFVEVRKSVRFLTLRVSIIESNRTAGCRDEALV